MTYEYQNLPIAYDDDGNPYVTSEGFTVDKHDISEQYEEIVPDGTGELLGEEEDLKEVEKSEGEEIYDINIDPVTRVAGALAFHAKVDLKKKAVEAGHSQATLFRGYEIILEGRDPRDAIDLSSRACGVCGAVHSICSSLALEMAMDVEPPDFGLWVRNMGQSAAYIYDHPLHLHLLAGPDYSEAMLTETNPDVYEAAQNASAPNADIHGYETIGEIMQELNPLEGELYLKGLEVTRTGREMASLMLGKYPHPSTIAPGGVTTTVTRTTFSEFYSRLMRMFDYAKKTAMVWDDLMDFMLDEMNGYEDVGKMPVNLIELGVWDDPEYYNARYEDAERWGRKRLATPGVVVDGELKTTSLPVIDQGIEEFVDHSFYEDWTDEPQRFDTNPRGDPISPYHPWNKETRPKPEGQSWRDKYSWSTSPRWDRTPMETGPHTRQWTTAMAEELDNPFIEPTGDGLNMTVPEHRLPEMELRWDIPDTLNAAERLRAKAYHVAYVALVAYTGFIEALELLKEGNAKVHNSFEVPQKGVQRGVGFYSAGRGYLTHHVTIEDGSIDNYQILTPSTWMASPTDPWGQPGPYEEAAENTPLLEDYSSREDFTGVDILRSVRSFDPCMPCTVHMHTDDRQDVITEDVSSCGCSFSEGDQPADEAIRDIIADADD